MKVWIKITLSLCFILVSFVLLSLIKNIRISSTGQLILTIGTAIPLLAGIAIAFPMMYKFFQESVSTATRERKKPPVVALDTNVLVNAFLYKHPEYTKEPAERLRDDYEILKLVSSGEIVGFVPDYCMKQARNVLYNKYNMHSDTVGEFYKDVINSGVKFSLNRPPRWDEQTVKKISSKVHDDDIPLIEYALQNDCNAVITDDNRMVKDPAILHYLPILYTRDFMYALDSGARTRKQLEEVAYKEFKEHK